MNNLWQKHKKMLTTIFIFLLGICAVFVFFIREDYQNYRNRAVPILEYHGIGDADGWMEELFVSRETFEKHLQYLHDNGYRIVSIKEMAEMFAKGEPTQKTVALTFDDGYLDNYTNVLPLLKKYNATATFFIVQSKIGHYRYMTHDQIRYMINNGMEIGSHTINHQILTDIKPEFLIWELATSKYFLKRDFDGYIVRSLSYPSGKYNDKILEATKKHGYQWAVTGDAGAVSRKMFEKKPLELGRSYVNDESDGIKKFEERLRHSYYVGYLKEHGLNIHFFNGL